MFMLEINKCWIFLLRILEVEVFFSKIVFFNYFKNNSLNDSNLILSAASLYTFMVTSFIK